MLFDQGPFRSAVLCCVALLALLAAPPRANAGDHHTHHTQQATGVVYHDRNGDQTRQPDEPGIPSVKVSNGRDVVATDSAGRYTLPVDDETILYVIKPRDWMTPLNELNLPQFFYVHKPQGSPDDNFLFPGSEPTGPLPDSVDFPLLERPEDDNFKVVMIGDPQPYDLEQLRFYHDDVIAELPHTAPDAAFAVALGDLVGDDLTLFEPYNRVNATVGIPFYNVFGNHDLNFRSTNDQHDDETFEATFGPADYAFEVADVCFVVLDNVRYLGYAGDRDDGFPLTNNYVGGLTEEQLTWLGNYVASVPTDRRIVLLMHIPLVSHSSAVHAVPQVRELLDILEDHPHTLSFSGHTHINQHHFLGPEHGAAHVHHHHNVVTASGSWYRGPLDERGLPETRMRDGAPNGYASVTFTGADDYRIRFKAAGRPDTDQLHIHLPDQVFAHRVGRAEVVANVYNGSARSTTDLRIVGHTDWTPMAQSIDTDPAYEAYKAQADVLAQAAGRRTLPNPWITDHLWRATLPADLPPGHHLVEVRTTDQHGQTDHARRTLTVLPAP